MNNLDMLILLIIAHFVADYVLQSDTVAKYKNYHNKLEGVPWYYWLLSHASTHGIAVYLITGNIWITVMEIALHFIIDWGKCAQKYAIHTDQLLHILCKIGFVLLIMEMVI